MEHSSARQLPAQLHSSHRHLEPTQKVCFGVFASLSHRFAMRHEAWAQEISTSLQSAFRVLALTRPELPQVTAMLLKTKGFRHSEELSEKVHECLALIRQELGEAVQERDDWFSLTTRAVKRLVDVASGMR